MNLIWEVQVGTNISYAAHYKETVRQIELGQGCVQW